MDLYVYYRVPAACASQLRQRVREMQAQLAADHGIVTSLKRRPNEKDGKQTWMEIYLAVPDGFEEALERAVAQASLYPLIDGQRHAEHFLDIPPCA